MKRSPSYVFYPMHRAFIASQRGMIAIKFALAVPVILMIVGTAVDYSTIRGRLTTLQSAVDAAAVAAAKELGLSDARTANTSSIVDAVARAYLAENYGQKANASGVAISTAVTDDPLAVHVIATETVQARFGDIFGLSAKSLKVEAVAKVAGRPNICVLGLDPDDMGTISLEKDARVTGNNCAVFSNSADERGLKARDSARLDADLICSRGGVEGSSANFAPEPILDCPSVDDPLAGRPEPEIGSCLETDLVINNVTRTLSPGTYCGGLTIEEDAAVRLNPGIYVIKDGPLTVSGGAMIQGENVGIFLTGIDATLNFTTNSSIDLAAPIDGEMAGVLLFEGRSQPEDSRHMIRSNDARVLLGTIYLPRGKLVIDANRPIADQSAYTAIVTRAMSLSGGPHLVLNTNYDLTPVPVPAGVQGSDQGVALLK